MANDNSVGVNSAEECRPLLLNKSIHDQCQAYEHAKLLSNFDRFVLDRWSSLQDKSHGVFRAYIEDTEIRDLGGDFSFSICHNPSLFVKKRMQSSPSDSHPAAACFDGSKFNFCKVSAEEIILQINFTEPFPRQSHHLLLNISPLSLGHVLLVPRMHEKHGQMLQPDVEENLLCAIRYIFFPMYAYHLTSTINQICRYFTVSRLSGALQ